jgi:hypothetical protein
MNGFPFCGISSISVPSRGALSALLNSGRYQLGFYAGRLYGLFAANIVLAMLLIETVSLYSRLARSLEKERRQADELARLARQHDRQGEIPPLAQEGRT